MATVVAVPAMKSSAVMEASSVAVKLVTIAEPTFAVEAAMPKAFVLKSAASEAAIAPAIMVPVAMPATTVEATAVPAGMTPIPVIPGPHADEYAVHEPLRTVIAIRRTGVRVIVIISIGANWRRAIIAGPNAHPDEHSLRACKRSAKETNAE
jgi:hypothetical protein